MPNRPATAHRASSVALAATLCLLAACGGGSTESATPAPVAPPAAPTGLSGSVAVGAPMTGATLRVLDARGQVVAENVAVAADGSYTIGTLGGTPPYRIEACGHAGPTYQCLHSVVAAAGTAHVTPLTTAVAMLASGLTPAELMAGTASAPAASAVSAAQDQLRTALAPVLDGNVPAGFDFATGALQAGSRTGYDRVLDAIGVNTGVDGRPFVQVTPRLGSGNLYLEPGSAASGQITPAAGAAGLDLRGLNGLFDRINAAIASAAACQAASGGLAAAVATDARLTMGRTVIEGRAALAQAFCQVFAEEGLLGARFSSPVLGRCDMTRATPVCRVSFGVQRPGSSEVQSLGVALGVSVENGQWFLRGDADELPIHVAANAQRSQRIDGDAVVNRYERALAIEVPALPGLACALATQRDAAGNAVPIAYLKPMAGADELERLSIWRPTAQSGADAVSLNPGSGALRNQDDTWLMLPEGEAGDAVARNFFRGGRSVQVALFADAACSAPFEVGGRSRFEVEIDGAPPVWSAMPGLPWPELTAAARATLSGLALAAGATRDLDLAWTYPRGAAGFGEASLCVLDPAQCGQGGDGRIAEARLAGGAAALRLALRNGAAGVAAGDYKSLALFGRLGDGTGIQANFKACSGRPAGEVCH